jgi:fatty acid desaturase
MLAYSADARPLSLVLLAACLSVSPFILGHFLELAVWQVAGLWLVSQYVRTHCPYAQHNHAHLPIFGRARGPNFTYDAILALVTGYPTAFWELQHNIGHHRNYLEPKSDVASIVDPRTGRPMSRVWYAVRGNFALPFDCWRIARDEAAGGRPRLLRKLVLELGVHAALMVLLYLWNAKLALLFFTLPNLLAAYYVWWESYLHHLGVPGTQVYDGSVTTLGLRFNWMNFNIGHHTAHHEKPTLHWSLLPGRTAQIAERIPGVCLRDGSGVSPDWRSGLGSLLALCSGKERERESHDLLERVDGDPGARGAGLVQSGEAGTLDRLPRRHPGRERSRSALGRSHDHEGR